MKLKRNLLAFGLIAVFTVFTACGPGEPKTPAPTKNIWELVVENADLGKFEAEMLNQGLDADLQGAGPMTLFAPSDQALTDLLEVLGIPDFSPVRDDIANAVLKYHILASKVASSEIVSGGSFTSSYNSEKIDVIDGPLLKSGATSQASVTTADIEATNGTIHIIDKVLVPYSIGVEIVALLGTVGQSIFLGKDFSLFADAVTKADGYATANTLPTLTSKLADKSGTKYTVFAQVNAIFASLPGGPYTIDSFTDAQWYGILSNHIVPVLWTDFVGTSSNTTLSGGTLTVLLTDAPQDPTKGINSGVVLDSDGDQTANGQLAAESAATGSNGVIHVVAGILAPAP
ncbi:MAG: fasciclin domain-containing protein [Cyclobacteriaceae bacterium]|nr:fasciclin domain-containing protein [Cyclobacteriaceae bacterium]